jgi:hypothetical protein
MLARQFLYFGENLGAAARIAALSFPKFRLALSVIVLFSAGPVSTKFIVVPPRLT